ncbi:hypothetical protein FH972_025031 [Carpinus fangiana]|uniref:Uncharacterized protein n=1 Tax=Carpinus fangiana TaxID=176857 RepID=A0A5N6L004_9ROSI|nr:hypothetical protein FH972_025031 [Carpinus fangiana]
MSYARSTKRQYQPQISSFFPPSSNFPSTTGTLNRTYSDSAAPPHDIQASLLSVGMRVRKAVPEGYKNVESKPVPALVKSVSAPPPVHYESSTRTIPRPAELAPFCGIHKIGGHAAQDTYEDSFAFPASSQESIMSNVSTESEAAGANLRKRGMQDDEDEEDFVSATGNNDVSFDPAYFDERLFGVLERGTTMSVAERPMARPVTRRHTNMRSSHGRIAVDDFDEADFLQPVSNDVDMEE